MVKERKIQRWMVFLPLGILMIIVGILTPLDVTSVFKPMTFLSNFLVGGGSASILYALLSLRGALMEKRRGNSTGRQ
jgi:hypothetical protein